ncbi:hypothetical protein BJX66DRAFT_306592 [Aspergillus keveii]|uniref:Uncharacterized protein n=1 Tax=Aspergillus keveii TaxID=714993 RepID=A0ABR4G2J3_9EURO
MATSPSRSAWSTRARTSSAGVSTCSFAPWPVGAAAAAVQVTSKKWLPAWAR